MSAGPVGAPAAADRALSHRDVLAIAIPITISNATTPLIGLVDTVIIGQVGAAHLIGGVAVAASIFNALYWGFGFLRMGTTGLTAQAFGARDKAEVAANLLRAGLIAAVAGLLMIIGQIAIAAAALHMMGAPDNVTAAARAYFDIRIWAAPAGLLNFALLGWFIGLQRANTAFMLQLLLNGLNVVFALGAVAAFGASVEAVAAAALAAEWIAALAGLYAAARELSRQGAVVALASLREIGPIRRMLAVNRDIMIRSFAVLAAFTFFTAQGARSGDVVLAANAILHAIAAVCVFLLDGFAFAAESLVGQAIGARQRDRLRRAVRLATIWAAATGVLLSVAVWLAGPWLIDLMTTSPEVRAAARVYLPWAALTPIVGVWCFLLDGIFIGATRTADMRNMMLASLLVYFAAWAILMPVFGNHGLWAAILVFFVARAITLAVRYPALERAGLAPQAPALGPRAA